MGRVYSKWSMSCVALLSFVLILLSLAVVRFNRNPITLTNFARVQPGMTVGEVEDILGPTHTWIGPTDSDGLARWGTAPCSIIVIFSKGKVRATSFRDDTIWHKIGRTMDRYLPQL